MKGKSKPKLKHATKSVPKPASDKEDFHAPGRQGQPPTKKAKKATSEPVEEEEMAEKGGEEEEPAASASCSSSEDKQEDQDKITFPPECWLKAMEILKVGLGRLNNQTLVGVTGSLSKRQD